MASVADYVGPVLEEAQNAIVSAVDSLQLRRDAPFSPDVSKDLLAQMPDLTGRLLLTFPWSKPKPVNPSEHIVWIFDNTAFRVDADHAKFKATNKPDASLTADPNKPLPPPEWQVEYVVAYFSRQSFRDVSHVIAQVAKLLDLCHADDSEDEALDKLNKDFDLTNIKQRLEPFVIPILPRHTIRVNISNTELQTLGPSTSSGISSDIHRLHFSPPPGTQLTTSAEAEFSPEHLSPGTTVCAEPTGWAVISDIDDTIKITGTLSPLTVLKTTFIDEPAVVPGMPELYAELNTLLSDPAFFYISASPYNLYPLLRKFREDYYPDGTIILREASWQNLGGLISSLSVNTKDYKVDRLEKLHSWFPRRQFVCIGDSTQKDPESYGEIARRHPGWVKAIFIRRVKDEGELLDIPTPDRNSDQRFEKAFKGLDTGLWMVFDEPDEMRKRVHDLV